MTPIKCEHLWVKFNKSHLQGQRISFNDLDFAQHLKVESDDHWLRVEYIDSEGDTRKIVQFNMLDVLEFMCEHIHREPKNERV